MAAGGGDERTGADLRDVIHQVVHADFGKALLPQEDGSVMLVAAH
jgi:hypothetical protein